MPTAHFDPIMTNAERRAELDRLYYAQMAADEAFSAALSAEYGPHAGDMRYRSDVHPAKVRELGSAALAAHEAWLALWRLTVAGQNAAQRARDTV